MLLLTSTTAGWWPLIRLKYHALLQAEGIVRREKPTRLTEPRKINRVASTTAAAAAPMLAAATIMSASVSEGESTRGERSTSPPFNLTSSTKSLACSREDGNATVPYAVIVGHQRRAQFHRQYLRQKKIPTWYASRGIAHLCTYMRGRWCLIATGLIGQSTNTRMVHRLPSIQVRFHRFVPEPLGHGVLPMQGAFSGGFP